MSESSHRLEQSRLAILEHIQHKKESPGMLRSALSKAASAAGFGRSGHSNGTAPATEHARPETVRETRDEEAAQVRLEEADAVLETASQEDPASRYERRAHRLFSDRFAGLGEAGRSYWQHHPARLVVELATPVLSKYAQRSPIGYLAAAAAAGAVIYLARPWRLISVSGLALAALRSPQLSSALISAFYGDSGPEDVPPR